LERVLNSVDNFLDINLLAGAIYSAQAVGRIEWPEGYARGTGFLIGPDLLLTNQHVLENKAQLADAIIRFDYWNDFLGVAPAAGRVYRFQPDFYHASPAEELDYALVRLTDAPLKAMTPAGQTTDLAPFDGLRQGQHRGYLVVAPRHISRLDRVNIIQHPDGNPLKAVMTQNYVMADMSERRVHYVADTMGGSSGSPVFNRLWEVVALHHAGQPYPYDQAVVGIEKDEQGEYRVNEGIPMRTILKDFEAKGLLQWLPYL
jgi:endonuclease G